METANISSFKSKISEFLVKVKKGINIVITDRNTPIAVVSSFDPDAIQLSPTKTKLFKIPESSGVKTDLDPLKYLYEDRSKS